MLDFTWKSLFKWWGVLCIPSIIGMISNAAPPKDAIEFFGYVVFTVMAPAPLALLTYGAAAPFIAAYKDAKRQTGSKWQGVLSAVCLLLALIPIALLMFVGWGIIEGFKYLFGDTIVGTVFGAVVAFIFAFSSFASLYDAIKYRLHLNKLNIFKLSDSRKIVRR